MHPCVSAMHPIAAVTTVYSPTGLLNTTNELRPCSSLLQFDVYIAVRHEFLRVSVEIDTVRLD